MINLISHLSPQIWPKSSRTSPSLLLLLLLLPLLAYSNDGDFENRLREAELAGDRASVTAICKEWLDSGKYSSGLLNWNYNALMSVEQNAILFTQQESDTYPVMLLQNAFNVRQDVRLLNLQWLENPEYRLSVIASEGLTWIQNEENLSGFIRQLLSPSGDKTSPSRPLYFGSMTNKNFIQADKDKLYLTGLALKFSRSAFDNVAMLRYNFENRFRTDYLELNLEPETEPVTVARVNMNYIPALLMLHRHYSAAGEISKATRIQSLSLRIAATNNREAEVRAFFSPESVGSDIVSALTPRLLEKPMKKVGTNLYASESELTNAQFEAFLTDLLKNKDFEQLALCRTSKTDWASLLPKDLQGFPDKMLFEHGHPDGPDFPVQNISHEAAQRYCAWITQVYNASTEKKRFKKVLFRLPTEAEWMVAARGGFPDAPYPWGGYFVRNSKGCYLGNYHATKPCGDCPGQTAPALASTGNNVIMVENDTKENSSKPNVAGSNDGGFFPVKVTSYYPNNFGLYAVSGNVAEMIAEPGKTKGGSWQDEPYYGQIQVVKEMTTPSPAIGFRVFMEVIQE